MKKTIIIISCTVTFVLAIIWFLYQKSWIIVHIPAKISTINISNQDRTAIKEIFIQQSSQIITESIEMIWTEDAQANTATLINHFLTCCKQHDIIKQKIHIQCAIIQHKTLFLSFNQNPLTDIRATLQKIYFLKSLALTIAKSQIPIDSIKFLVNHQSMIDNTLNFQALWSMNTILQCSENKKIL